MMDTLFESFEPLTVLIKFMMASTVMLGSIWLLEKLRVLRSPDLAELGWKLAIAGSFLALLPVGDWLSAPIRIEHETASELVHQFNEGRPFETATASEQGGTTVSVPDITPVQQAAAVAVQSGARAEALTTDPTQPPSHDSETAPAAEKQTTLEDWMASLRMKDLALFFWSGAALMALLFLGSGYAQAIRGLGSRHRVAAEHPANQTLRAICANEDIRHVPYLSRSSSITSPVCLPGREICLPDWAFEDLPEAEMRSLLAHELGHMVRRDPIMLMTLQVMCRLFFFQPLFLLARRRLTDLAEFAADEWAATRVRDARSVAAALFTCASKIHETRQIEWGLAMAGNKSMLKTRVERLIGADTGSFKKAGMAAKGALALGIIAVTMGLPSIQFAEALIAPDASFLESANVDFNRDDEPHVSISRDDRGHSSGNMVYRDGDQTVKANWDGEFTLTDDDRHVASIEGDGTLTLQTKGGAVKRKIRFENEDGKLTHTYWVNGKKATLDAKGEKWLGDALVTLVRQTGLNAEDRVARILKTGGAPAVISEIKLIESDYVRQVYTRQLVGKAELKSTELTSLVDVLSTIESDYELRMALGALVSAKNLTAETLPKVLRAAEGIDSDYEMRQLLTPYIKRFGMDDKAMAQLLDLSSKMDSDYEMRQLLTSAITGRDLTTKNLEKFVELAAKEIGSDYEMRMLLSSAAEQYAKSKPATKLLIGAIGTMGSDYEKRLTLEMIVENGAFDNGIWMDAIEATDTIGSDYEKRLVLAAIRDRMPKDKKLQEAFREAVSSIGSDYEREQLSSAASTKPHAVPQQLGSTQRTQLAALIKAHSEDIHAVDQVIIKAKAMAGTTEQRLFIQQVMEDQNVDNYLALGSTIKMLNAEAGVSRLSPEDRKQIIAHKKERWVALTRLSNQLLQLAADIDSEYEKFKAIESIAKNGLLDEAGLERLASLKGSFSTRTLETDFARLYGMSYGHYIGARESLGTLNKASTSS